MRKFLLILPVFFLLPIITYSQNLESISGRLIDQQGQGMPGVKLNLYIIPNIYQTASSSNGSFIFSDFPGFNNGQLPSGYAVSENYPNPFNTRTRIDVMTPADGIVKVDIYNIVGQRVIEEIEKTLSQGTSYLDLELDGLPSGFYVARINLDGKYFFAKKLILMSRSQYPSSSGYTSPSRISKMTPLRKTTTAVKIDSLVASGSLFGRKTFTNLPSITGSVLDLGNLAIDLPPKAPALAKPNNFAVDQSSQPILSWNECSLAKSYTLQVSTIKTFASFIYNQSGLIDTSQQLNGLSNLTQYYWRVFAINDCGPSAYSSTWTFTTKAAPPSAPVLSLPGDNAVDISVAPTLAWNSSTTAKSYTLQVSTDSTFASFVYNQNGLSDTSQQVKGLSSLTRYYWRVIAANSYGTSVFSSICSFTTLGTPPPAPVLLSPANYAVNISLDSTFSWNASPTAESYTLQISTGYTFTNLVYNRSGLTGTSRNVEGLSNLTHYFWRVRAANRYGTSASSIIWSFTTADTPPSAPVLSSPADNAVDISITPTLTWNASAEAASYTLQVSTISSFSSFVYNQSGIKDTSLQIKGLSNLTKYYWRVSVINNHGTSAFSNTRSFTTIGTPPSAPFLSSPSKNAVDISLSPVLTWNACVSAKSYTLQVSTDSSFSHYVYNHSGLVDTSQQITGLSDLTRYYWRVRAANSYGTSAYSSARIFTTLGTHPVIPTLSSPADNSVDVSATPTLIWKTSAAAKNYTLQVSTDSTFASYVYNQSGLKDTTKQLNGLSYLTHYYWRVSAANSYGTSAYSSIYSFTTLGTPPAPPILSSPADNAVDISITPVLSWNASASAASYTLQVSGDSTFSSFVYNESNITETNRQVSGLNNLATYYWRVKATNKYGSSGYLATFSFKTLGTPPAKPTLSSPADNALDIPASPTLAWNASASATSYTLQVSANSLFSSFVYNQSGIAGTSRQVTGLSSLTKYYWRVSAANNYGTSAYSDTWSYTTTGTPPPAPVLSSPADKTIDMSVAPALTWNASPSATSYTIQVSTNSSFSSFVYNQSGLTGTSRQINGLGELTRYYWRVSATNSYGTSGYSSAYFTTIGTPALLSPANNSVDISVAPVFTWHSTASAASYILQVSTDNTFSSFVYNQAGPADTSRQVNGLNNWATYYWRVIVTNNFGTSAYSSTWTFKTVGTPPAAPTLYSPADNTADISLSPTLTWNASAKGTSYTLQVSTNSSFSSFVYDQSGLTGTNQQINGLNNLTKYYWRVSAANNYGTSAYSNTLSFTTIDTPPAAPVLSSPANNSVDISVVPTLTWNPSAKATSYTLQVSTNSSFSSLVYNQSGLYGTNQQINGLKNQTKYYWRVSATNIYGTSAYSSTWSYTTTGTTPPAPELSSPADNAVDISITPTLTWNESASATSYTLQVSTDNTFSNLVYNQSGIAGTSRQVTGLSSLTKYYWRVSAANSYGTSAYSDTWSYTTTGTPPPAPVLSSPADKAVDISVAPVLTWNASTSATSYTLQVSKNSSFSSFVYNQSGLTGTSRQINGLSELTRYYWRVSATNSYGTSGYSSAYYFTTIGTPALLSPANNSVDISVAPVFTWHSTASAASYTLQVSTDNTFSSFVYNQAGLVDTSRQVNGLNNRATYYWRVIVTNNFGTSAYSSTWSFKTVGTPPAAPLLSSPADNTVDISLSPTLTWNTSPSATSYTLQVSKNSSFSSTVYNQSGLTGTSQQVNGLSNLTKYYWRVSAANSYGTSPYSSTWSYTTTGTPPAAPVLSSPADNAVDISVAPSLSWNASAAATSYTLQVSTDNTFSSFIYDQSGLTGTSQQVSGLSNLTKYYWRVSATNSYGTSPYSTNWSYTTTGTPPSAPVLSSPADNAVDISVAPSLSWNASAAATSYTLQVSADSSFSSFVYNQSGLAGTSQQVNGLSNLTKYYWRVSAANSYGTSPYSSTWGYTTTGIPPAAPVLSSPADNAVDISVAPSLSWNASAAATSYTLQVSADSSFSSTVYNQSGLAGTSQQVSGLSNLTKYYWRVSATNSYGTSPYSSAWAYTTTGTPPAAPVLSSPVDNAVDISVAPSLSWNASAAATSYTLQVSADSSFSSTVYNQSGLAGTSQQVSGLSNLTKYYWRVSATNSYGTSAYSSAWAYTTTGTPPAVPVLSSPVDNAVDISVAPSLSWNASAAATSYTLQVSADSSFSSTVYNQSGLSGTSQQVSGLSNLTKYYWRVSATNSYGTSAYSNVWAYTTTGTPPAAPVLSSPANNSVDISVSPTLTWNASASATSYTLQVSADSSFSSTVYNQSGLAGTSQQVSGLSNLTKYYWRVSATNSYGTSAYSNVWAYTTTGTPPSAPVLSSPANNAVDISVSPTLTWNASASATSYTLQVSADSSFSSTVYNQSGLAGTSQQVSGLSNLTKYYWRVSATNSYGTSAYSSVWSYTTTGTPPSAPVLSSPANNAVDISVSPTLTWNASASATSYTLQVSTDNTFSSFVYNQSGLAGTSQQVSGLNNLTKYYWRVSATNSYGTSAYSSAWAYTTTGTPPSAPALSSPANNVVDISVSPTLTWNASASATSYTLQVSTNSSFSSTVYNQSGLAGTSQQVNGLSSQTQYYWRVSATNSYGTSAYSGTRTFTTIFVCGAQITYAGKVYNTVLIGSQCWMKENLNVGTMIQGKPGFVNSTDNGTIEKYCYNNLESNCATYGGMYQWNEAMAYSTTPGTQGICPSGWHIPTKAELQTLSTTVSNNSNNLKAVGQGSGAGAGNNTSGFSQLMGGWMDRTDGSFHALGAEGSVWSSTQNDGYNSWIMYLDASDTVVYIDYYGKSYAWGVRCLHD